MTLYEITLSKLERNFKLLHVKTEKPEYIELGNRKVLGIKINQLILQLSNIWQE